MLELMVRAVVIAGLVTAAAVLLERGLAHLRAGTRYAWTFALMITALAPFMPRFTSARVEVIPLIQMPAMIVNATSDAGSRVPINWLLVMWLLLSAVMLTTYASAYVKLMWARRSWQTARIAQADVFVSDGFGPAVFGFLAPRIVVPRWVVDRPAEEQELIVLHEREHIRVGDQLQLLLAIASTVLMPWNPFTWWQARRLRFTIESDCDQRVLAAAPNRARYASLLVNVGSRQSGLSLTPALAEHGNVLEARLRMLTQRCNWNPWKAAALMIMGLSLAVMACESRTPQDLADGGSQQRTSGDRLPAKVRRPSVETPISSAASMMAEEYPALLRDAGIGGTVGLRVHVSNRGVLDRIEVSRTSGHEAMDQAAVRVVRRLQWRHEGPDHETSYWASTSITFSPDLHGMKIMTSPASPPNPS